MERSPSEHALRRAVLAGDEDAWRALYDRAFDPLHAFVLRRCGRDHALAEDVLSECFLVAVRRIRSFDPDRGPFLAWLVGIARNALRSAWRRRRATTTVPLDDVATRADAPGLETTELISMTLASLPERHRRVLRCKYEQDLTVAEIAARDGQTPKSVESLLTRARESFRDAYRRIRGAT